jgi:protein-ribulosamine 3-kinase
MSAPVPGEITYALHEHGVVKSFTSVSGGCINHGGKLVTSDGEFFLKWNDAGRFPGMFEAEAKGLALLARHCGLRIPRAVCVGLTGNHQFILMEYMESKSTASRYWEELGRGLAQLHGVTATHFGLDHDNYIGSLLQRNKQELDWTEFFVQQRLEPQLQMLHAAPALRQKFDKLSSRLDSIFPDEKPSLIHGDLWSGNLIRDKDGLPCLIDPAVYYGHREMELAFTRLFGGFDRRFYDTYKEVFALEPGYEDRSDLCNLYPLLVHANLFGGHYMAQIEDILRRWA